MKTFKPIITLSRNSRGCYILDTIKGCSACNSKSGGCYGDCYALKIADRYRLDFTHPTKREFYRDQKQIMLFDFLDERHMWKVMNEIRNIDMPFVRIGEMGDPSEDWEHTISVCEAIKVARKPIVIITKHWKSIPNSLLDRVKALGLYINTSVSALDDECELEHRCDEYERLKPYCNSILRVVSCEFNMASEEGRYREMVQTMLYNNDCVIDTVFRPSAGNRLVKEKVIHVEKVKFLGTTMLASVRNDDAYIGMCDTCPDMCGLLTPRRI